MGSPKALPNFQRIVGVEEYCFNMMSHKKNLHSVNIYVSTDIRRSTTPITSQQTVKKKTLEPYTPLATDKKVDKSEE